MLLRSRVTGTDADVHLEITALMARVAHALKWDNPPIDGWAKTLTPLVMQGFATEEVRAEEARSSGVITQPLRLAEADEIAAAVLYLCGPFSAHVTGMTMHVNGGTLMP